MKNVPKRFVLTSSFSILRRTLALGLCVAALPAAARLQWSSYDTSGNLVTANVATGGGAGDSSVTFTIPANTQLSFATKSFTPFSLTGPSARQSVTFNVSASAGLGSIALRTMGWGLYNSAGTAALTDDVGYFGLWNGGGPFLETYDHPAGSGNLLSGTKLGQGTSATGTPADGSTYTNQILLVMNAAVSGISLGTSSSTLPNAGLAMNGLNGASTVAHRVFTNPVIPVLGGVNSFDEFVFMFNNTTGNPVSVTISSVSLVNFMTWDSSGTNSVAPVDGAGNWSSTNVNWSMNGSSDNVWSPGYNAVIGSHNGAAGTITITDPAGVTVSNLTFNGAGSGNYNIAGTALILTGTPTVTAANGVVATNSAPLGGNGFTKAGNGTFVLLPSAAATNTGTTTVNAGTLLLASTAVNSLAGNVVVNSGAILQTPSSVGIVPSGTLTINGGAVTNLGLNGTSTETHNTIIWDNNGTFAYGPTGSGQHVVTNCDFRSGLDCFPKWSANQTLNFSVKSTPGTMAVQSRPNNTGPQGLNLTVLAGTMILDYPNPAPNGDSTQGGAKLINTNSLTLAGGTLFGRFNAAASRTEAVLGTIVRPGATALQITNNAANGTGSYGITLANFTRSVGGTVDFSAGGTSSGTKNLTTTSANVNGILGGWATYGGTDWAVGSPIVPLAAANYQASTDPTTWGATSNVTLNASTVSNVGDGTNVNSLRLTAASTVTLDGTLTLTSGGLLVTGSGATAISGGTLKGASGADLVVNQYASADLTVSSTLADNGSASSLTKSGPGKLILTGTDNLTGTNYLNGGTTEVGDLAKLAAGPVLLNTGTLRYTGSDATSARSIVLNGAGGTIDVAGSATLTQSTPVVSGGGATSIPINGVVLNLGDWSGLTKVGSGTLSLAANNVYNGPTVVSNGVLAINGINSLTGTSGGTNYTGGGTVTVYGGTLGGTGTIPGVVTIKNGGTIAPGNSIGTLTLASDLSFESGSTGLFEIQNGVGNDLIVVQGNLNIGPNTTIAIKVLGPSLSATTNTIITYSGNKSGSFNPTVVVAGGILNSSISIDESTPGQIKLVAVPQVVITGQPQDLTVSTNDPASFTVTATGAAVIHYQWYRYADITGSSPVAQTDQTNATFSIASAQSTDTGFYGVVVTNDYNSVTSRVAILTVGDVPPVLSGPSGVTVIAGNNATFSGIVALGNPYPYLQWQTNSVDVPGANSTNLTLLAVPYAFNGMTVSLIATNRAGTATNSATLTVLLPPFINPQPTNITVNEGDPVTFFSGAGGDPVPGLQWFKNNTAIPGQNGPTYSIASAQGSDIATYKLVATNIAGAATSSIVSLTVNSTNLSSTALSSSGATGVCYDTPLYITFSGPVFVANSGKIRIYNANNSTTPVDIIDMSSNVVVVSGGINLTNNIQAHSPFPGDSQQINYFPVITSGNVAAIYPHGGVMTSNQTYYVTLDNGIVKSSTGAYFAGLSDTNAWRFTTKPNGPANPTNLVVAADGSGDFATVQGAVDSIALGNTNYALINVRNGNYVEIVNISGKSNVTFRGQSRLGTLVGYPNNNNLNGTTAARMSFKVNGADIKIENLTITNGTPQGGSQAEALLVYNSGFRCVVENCDIVSRQDTILINANTSQAYLDNCRVVGNFDYIWGVGVGYFNRTTFHTVTNTTSSSYNLTAARTATSGALSAITPWINPNGTTYSAYGFSFVNSTFEADSGVTGITLAGSNGTAGGMDSWALCCIDTNAYVSPSSGLSNTYVFWQYSNLDITCTIPISFTNVQTIGITNGDPRLLAATNPTVWFSGWTPQIAPNILTNPVSQSIAGGGSATFTVFVTGVPDPTYQWLRNGTNLVGQTGSSLTITGATANDAGLYSVIVSNAAGSVTSTSATLTVGNINPTLSPIVDQTINAGAVLTLTASASDPDVPAQTLTFSLQSAPANASIDPSTGLFSWRPLVSQANTTNLVTIVVTDNGTPNLSASQSFNVIVNPLIYPTLGSGVYSGGTFSFEVSGGTVGPDYVVLVSTNLPIWEALVTNPAPTLPFTVVDTNTTPQRFYRVQLVP